MSGDSKTTSGRESIWNSDMNEYINARIPLFYVFLSGIGFSLQSLIIKVITEQGFRGSFQCVFLRGTVQFILAGYYVYWDSDRLAGKGPSLFGDTTWVKLIILLRALAGFGSIAFAFLAVELIPIGDSTVLMMLSPLLASIMSFVFLGEAWRLPEFVGTVLSLVGAVMVAKPPLIFGGQADHDATFYKGVMFALFAAVSAAFAYIFVRILGTTAKMPWANVCFAQAIGQLVLSIPSLYISGQEMSFNITGIQLLLLFTGGLIGAVSQILMTYGMQREKSAAATAMRMSDVAFGFLWQVLFTPDKLSLLSLGGAMLITCSILIIVAFKQPNTPAVEQGDDKAVEMRQLAAAMHSIRDSLSLQESYDLEPGFEHENMNMGEDDDFGGIFASKHSRSLSNGYGNDAGTHNGTADASAGDEDFEFIGPDGVCDPHGNSITEAAAGAAGLDSVEKSFLARMIKSPLYSMSTASKASGAGHQYSTLSLGLDDSIHNGAGSNSST